MAFTRSWDEADPATSDNAADGAAEMQDIKEDVRERMCILETQAGSGWNDDGFRFGIVSVGSTYSCDSTAPSAGASTVADVMSTLFTITQSCDMLWEFTCYATNTADSGVEALLIRFELDGVDKWGMLHVVPGLGYSTIILRGVETNVSAANHTLQVEAYIFAGKTGSVELTYPVLSVTPCKSV